MRRTRRSDHSKFWVKKGKKPSQWVERYTRIKKTTARCK